VSIEFIAHDLALPPLQLLSIIIPAISSFITFASPPPPHPTHTPTHTMHPHDPMLCAPRLMSWMWTQGSTWSGSWQPWTWVRVQIVRFANIRLAYWM
jgi:hypothetical protein